MNSKPQRVQIGDVVLDTVSWDPHGAGEGALIDYIDIGSVDQMAKRITAANRMLARSAPSRARQLVRTDDVLVSTVRPNLNAVALVPAEYDHATASTGFTILRADARRLSPRYLFRWATSPAFVRDMTRRATGASYPAVSDNIVKKSEIPLPAVNEQNRIAAILDRADAIRLKSHEALDFTTALLGSAFLEMFGDPLSNQKGWPMSNFGTEMKLVQYGPRFYNQPYTPTGVHVIRITDLDVFGNLAYDQMPRFDAPRDAIRTFGLQTGDLVFARSGATVGKTAVIGSDAPPCIAGAYFMRIQFHARITPIYARMVLASNSVQNIITRQSRQSAQQNFSGPSLRRLPLPVPPMDIQQRFCGVERAIRAHAVLLSSHLLDADHLFNALVQQAFSGDLLTDRTKAAHPSL